jgi:hypothetical protein
MISNDGCSTTAAVSISSAVAALFRAELLLMDDAEHVERALEDEDADDDARKGIRMVPLKVDGDDDDDVDVNVDVDVDDKEAAELLATTKADAM